MISKRDSKLLNQVLDAINAEPEFPGPMPDDLWELIRNNRGNCEQSHRLAVQATKSNIKERLMRIWFNNEKT